ncbi:Prp21p [Saccharomyces eubayanus]|uniref:Prp21p n=1 Tax=Saccharomyces eubayanus TaxID=1080349 RepID=UPI0006C09B0B|nr:PRP21-like protein [Saccharomyces eubayanus]KOG98425.1 PRP21-like protein [Saccharomyces eubayanus]
MEPQDPQIREDIKTTATYIKQHGASFESKLLEDERFSFIKKDDPLHEYYIKVLNEPATNSGNEEDIGRREHEIAKPQNFLFSQYDTGISRRDMEIIKLTARYCALDESNLGCIASKHGEGSLQFLNSSHPLHNTFTDFVTQYKRIISSEDQQIKKTKSEIIDECFGRAQYWEFAKDQDQEHNKLVELCKIQFAAIPWDEFTQVAKFFIPDHTDTLVDALDLSQMRLRRVQPNMKIFDRVSPVNEEQKAALDQVKSKGGAPGSKKRKIRAAGETRLKKNKK